MFKTKIIFLGTLLISCLLLSGCIFVIGGAVGVLGGYAISQDTIQGETSKSFTSIWSSAVEVLNIMGDVSIEDAAKGVIEASVDSSRVKIDVVELVPGVVRLRVKARKSIFPNIKLAQKIYVKIIENAS